MNESGLSSSKHELTPPFWLLAELTYECPLQCSYCSNPTDYRTFRQKELTTDEWISVLHEARKMGAVQLGLSGGEPLLRKDLEILVEEANFLGFYSNLITSTVGLTTKRLERLKEAGLDHIQVSFQGSNRETNNLFSGRDSFNQKINMAKEIKAMGYPMVLNFVLHKHNIEQLPDILDLCLELNADYVELANCQYYGWAHLNVDALLPTKEQLEIAEQQTAVFRTLHPQMEVFFIVPDYFETIPKRCANGWGSTLLTVSPDGSVLPCQGAKDLPNIQIPNIKTHDLREIWEGSSLFNLFRGTQWMKEPCRSCDNNVDDLGGCRCQAYLLTGDPGNTDPVCHKSKHHEQIINIIDHQRPKQDQKLRLRTASEKYIHLHPVEN